MKADEIWQAALGELQLEMTRATFETWVKPTSLMSYEDGRFAVAVPNAYAQEWLQNRLLSTVKRVLTGITGRSVEVKFVVWSKEEKKEPVALLNGVDQNTQTMATVTPLAARRRPAACIRVTSSIPSSSATAIGWRTPPVRRWPKSPRPNTIPCSCTAALAWARHTCCTPLVMYSHQWAASVVCLVGRVHQRTHQRHSCPEHFGLPRQVSHHRRAASRRHSIHRRQGIDAGGVLSYLQRVAWQWQADRDDERSPAQGPDHVGGSPCAAALNGASLPTFRRRIWKPDWPSYATKPRVTGPPFPTTCSTLSRGKYRATSANWKARSIECSPMRA